MLLLPHGYEGQGPDHSSARLERFLEPAADINLRIANCTTAAQYFHLLRRQALLLTTDPLPLVVMTPKSLLRHPLVASTLARAGRGRAGSRSSTTPRRAAAPATVRRLVLCSGKVYVDLVSSERAQRATPAVAICRVEQLYPFPADGWSPRSMRYPNAARKSSGCRKSRTTWAPGTSSAACSRRSLGGRLPVRYVGRPRSASPAEGSVALRT